MAGTRVRAPPQRPIGHTCNQRPGPTCFHLAFDRDVDLLQAEARVFNRTIAMIHWFSTSIGFRPRATGGTGVACWT